MIGKVLITGKIPSIAELRSSPPQPNCEAMVSFFDGDSQWSINSHVGCNKNKSALELPAMSRAKSAFPSH